jgi:hypothetical protein
MDDATVLYESFAPAEARRILNRLEFHFTPKHASWLNQVEIELSVLSRQCLDRRIPERATLDPQIQAGQHQRKQQKATVEWRFSASDARNKWERSYPRITHQT